LMEDTHNTARDSSGWKREAAVACNTAGNCSTNYNGSTIGVAIPNPGGVIAFDAHSHGNEGRVIPNNNPTTPMEIFGWGPSSLDLAEFDGSNQQHPSYVVGQFVIWRIDRDANGNRRVTSFDRWSY
jgi:hypothetical protein